MAQLILYTKEKQIKAKKSRLVVVCGGRGREWDEWAVHGVWGCKLSYLEWMGSGALLYSTGNCV